MAANVERHFLFGYHWRARLVGRGGAYPRDPQRVRDLPHDAGLEAAQRRRLAEEGIETLHDLFRWLVRRALGTETADAYEVGKARFFDALRWHFGDPFVVNMWGSLTRRGGGNALLEDCEHFLRLRKRAAAAADALAIARTAFAAPPSAGEATRALKTALNIRCDGGDVTDDGHSSSGVSSCVGSPALGGAEDGALPSPPPLRLPVRVLRRSQEDDWRELVMSTARLVLGEAEVPLAPFAAPAPVRRA